jgi:HK97 gp10 family phage protein
MATQWIRPDFKWNGDKVLAAIEKKDAALIRVGMDIQEAAKQNATRSVKTGNLRGSINYALSNSASPVASPAKQGDGLSPHGQKDEVWIGTNVKYARRIEYGFVGKDKLGRNYNQAAQPYLRPAVEQQKDRIARIIADILGLQIKGAVS